MIQLQNISYRYPDGTGALSNITLRVREGEKLVIAGANGAGKSTLFLILNGILKPMSGHYVFDGKQVKYSKADLLQLRKHVQFQSTFTNKGWVAEYVGWRSIPQHLPLVEHHNATGPLVSQIHVVG